MIKPKKSRTQNWSLYAPKLEQHIKDVFQQQIKDKDDLWGKIVQTQKKQKNTTQTQSVIKNQKSISTQNNILNVLQEQSESFLNSGKKSPNQQAVHKNDSPEQRIIDNSNEDWQFLSKKLNLSPIRDTKNEIQHEQTFQPAQNDQCKIQDHENNLIKFVCLVQYSVQYIFFFKNQSCHLYYQKACAHCIIEYHQNHFKDMMDLNQFQQKNTINQEQAKLLFSQGEDILNKFNDLLLNDFFENLKTVLLQKLEELKNSLGEAYSDQIKSKNESELAFIREFNFNFTQIPDKHSSQYFKLISQANMNKYSLSLKKIRTSIKQFQIKQSQSQFDQIKKSLEQKVQNYIYGHTKQFQPIIPFQVKESSQPKQETYSTPRETNSLQVSPRNHSFHNVIISPRSPLHVFNPHINSSRNVPKIISNTQHIIYFKQ